MSVMLGRFQFDGPYATPHRLPDSAGVFAILCREDDGVYRIDIDHSDDMRASVCDRNQFAPNEPTTAWSVITLCLANNAEDRQTVVNELKAEYDDDCITETVAA